ncbi:helix-turn-helix domain-containing protein [Microvirga sp. 17 mud 1-3]|uniref:helix-turn-helix domain-containing protein n=1 Tax=Microvirga sp. 17 mud 1-3 TaxID=2082949 RepID=UPI000D6B0ED2|nr:helix-turn-helix domain-containing protein [Microvirga sp. 17 mud 1-3]AWM87343.1 hypothetical protein C4E04_11765 [Microvirga sp. 17 mud 1-3]
MPKREPVVARLVLALVCEISRSILNQERFGTHADTVILCCAIHVGHAEGRPMSASKLADYAGMPRPTVIRKLRELEACGAIERTAGGGFVMSRTHAFYGRGAMISEAARLIHKAAGKLSKMDSKGIAPRRAIR